jgi:hypothetical protein
MRPGVLMLGLIMMSSPALAGDKQIRPLIGITFGGRTTLVDLEDAAGGRAGGAAERNVIVGVGGVWLGNLFGLDVDVAHAPGFFQSDNSLVLSSSVTTITGNLVVALPRRLTEYSLRPYLVGGGGLMHASITDVFDVLPVRSSLATFDFGGGATGFVTKRIGLCWEVRRFQSVSQKSDERVVDFGPKKLSFWRASMGIAIRY